MPQSGSTFFFFPPRLIGSEVSSVITGKPRPPTSEPSCGPAASPPASGPQPSSIEPLPLSSSSLPFSHPPRSLFSFFLCFLNQRKPPSFSARSPGAPAQPRAFHFHVAPAAQAAGRAGAFRALERRTCTLCSASAGSSGALVGRRPLGLTSERPCCP